MTPLRRWIRDLLEKALDRYAEGPRLPRRFVDCAEHFYLGNEALDNCPRGARKEMIAFAVGLASSAYRDGYVRGFEAVERFEKPWAKTPTPEQIADAEADGWRDSPAFVPDDG